MPGTIDVHPVRLMPLSTEYISAYLSFGKAQVKPLKQSLHLFKERVSSGQVVPPTLYIFQYTRTLANCFYVKSCVIIRRRFTR